MRGGGAGFGEGGAGGGWVVVLVDGLLAGFGQGGVGGLVGVEVADQGCQGFGGGGDGGLHYGRECDAFGGDGCHGAGQAGGEAFEDFAFDPGAEAQGGDGETVGIEDGVEGFDRAGEGDAGVRVGQRLAGPAGAGDGAGDIRILLPDQGHDVVEEPVGGVDVRGVAVAADEGDACTGAEVRAVAGWYGPGDGVDVDAGGDAGEVGGFRAGVGDDAVDLAHHEQLLLPGGGGELSDGGVVLYLRLAGEAQMVQVGDAVDGVGRGFGAVAMGAHQPGIGGGDFEAVHVYQVVMLTVLAQHGFDSGMGGGGVAGDAGGGEAGGRGLVHFAGGDEVNGIAEALQSGDMAEDGGRAGVLAGVWPQRVQHQSAQCRPGERCYEPLR